MIALLTPVECLGRLVQAGGSLKAEPDGSLLVCGLNPGDLDAGTLAGLRAHKTMLHRYVSAFPDGCWPCEVPMD